MPVIHGTTLPPSLGFLLNDAAHPMRRRFDREARPLGLARAMRRVLAHPRATRASTGLARPSCSTSGRSTRWR